MGRGFEPHGAHVTSLEEIHQSGDYLTHEKLWIHSLRNPDIEYRNGYFLTTQGRWRGFEWSDVRSQSLEGKTLVIGHSDDDVTSATALELFATSGPKSIFATNLTADAAELPGVFDLPLGIPNDERQSRTHIIQADDTLLRKAWKRAQPPKDAQSYVIYANFSVRNHQEARRPALEQISKIQGSKLGKFVLSKKGRLLDFIAMRESGLVICPRGAGMDTHRFQECLLLGAIPVVLNQDHCGRLAQNLDLPVISVEAWSDLQDRQILESKIDGIRQTDWNLGPLTAGYWKNLIENPDQ